MHSLSTRLLTERKAIDCDVIAFLIRAITKTDSPGQYDEFSAGNGPYRNMVL
jgi:hypothetical protein